MGIPDKAFDIKNWGSFKIPVAAFAFVAILLLFRNPSCPHEIVFIHSLIKYAIGASVISYCQSLAFTTYRLNKGADDLPIFVQVVFMIFHAGWFCYWFFA